MGTKNNFMRNQNSLRKSPRPSFRSKNGPEVKREKKEKLVIRESGSSLRAIDLKKESLENNGLKLPRRLSLFLYQKAEDGSRRRSEKMAMMELNLLLMKAR